MTALLLAGLADGLTVGDTRSLEADLHAELIPVSYTHLIVGRTEADPLNGKISDESPVGHALLEKAVGDTAEVLLPTGHTVNYKVLGITHSAN